MGIKKTLTKDWKWVIAVTVTLLTGAIPVLLSFIDKPVKGIAYDYWSYPLADVSTLTEDSSFVVLYNDIEIDSLSSLIFVVHNSGNVPIERENYETNISLTLEGGATILSARTAATFPEEIPTSVRHSGDTITLEALLLNPGDEIRIQGLVTGTVDDHNVRVRISGVEKIHYQPTLNPESSIPLIPIYSGLLFGAICYIFGLFIIFAITKNFDTLRRKVFDSLRPLLGLFSFLLYGAGANMVADALEELGTLNFWIALALVTPILVFIVYIEPLTRVKESSKDPADGEV